MSRFYSQDTEGMGVSPELSPQSTPSGALPHLFGPTAYTGRKTWEAEGNDFDPIDTGSNCIAISLSIPCSTEQVESETLSFSEMTGRVSLICLFVLATVVYVQTAKEIYVKVNEMVALRCPGRYHGGDNLNWTSYTTQKMDLTSMSPAEQRKMDLLVLENYLIILKASANHQGNYSCSPGSGGRLRWMRLTVYTVLPREYEERVLYTEKCNIPDSCTLNCPDVNTPSINITRSSITWHKDGKSLPKDRIFDEVYSLLNVKMKDRGVYTCTRSYLYLDHIYNMSFTVVLDVQPKEEEKLAKIKSPRQNETVEVVLGSSKVINCTADYYSNFDEVFWLVGGKFVGTNNSLVFYNFTRNNDSKEMTASLVFTKVSEEDLSKNYTCKLQSDSQYPEYVSISLVKRPHPSFLPLVSSIVVGIILAIVVTIVIVVFHGKFKRGITRYKVRYEIP